MPKKSLKSLVDSNQPYVIEGFQESIASTRRNIAGTIERSDKFKNIDDGLIPFKNSNAYGTGSSTDCHDAVVLCQKCYYNFATFRNIIDLMTEFSVNNIFFKGGSRKSKDFFTALFNKINLWDFQDKFFREYYRSSNVFIFRFDTKIQQSDIGKISQIFGEETDSIEKLTIPSRYIILNPADIRMVGSANFAFGEYFKLLNEFEVAQLKSRPTEEDKEIFNSLSQEAKEQIQKGSRAILIKLDPAKIAMVFSKKQDYEPFAVPMGYPVLEDINAKAEMKKIDMAIARTMQQIVLLITNGNEPEKGGINQKNLDALKSCFTNQSVGRVIVADYTTKATWAIPDIGSLLNPEKYAVLERDINIGLNNVFAGEEKFANQAQKVELFVARLEQARKAFLNNFLIPEIKRIAKSVGLKNYPTPYFEDVELKDNTNEAKLYTRLMELGILTPEQGLKAIETNTLPDPDTMEEDQQRYKKQREDDLYKPLVGGAKEAEEGNPGGPLAAPKKVTPIGKASQDEEKYSLTKLKEHMILAQELESDVIEALKIKHNIQRVSKLQKEVAQQITHLIIANEESQNWKVKIKDYIETPEDKNQERVNKIIEIAANHSVPPYLAGLLLASKM